MRRHSGARADVTRIGAGGTQVREANGMFRVYVGPYPNRDKRRVAERISTAFGFATAVAPH